jgi:2',3'-cyclic-nucleotide 2'-phosphodiesterase (5'-nucleotidase family)
MNEDKIDDYAEALYHPEHLADDLSEIAQVEDSELEKLVEVAYEQVKQLVRERVNGSDAQVVISSDKVANCGVELGDALVDEIVEYINEMVANCDYDLNDMLNS